MSTKQQFSKEKPETVIIADTRYLVAHPQFITRAQQVAEKLNLEINIHNAKQTAFPPSQRLIRYPVPVPPCITLKRLDIKMSRKTAKRMMTKNPKKFAKELAKARATI